jgi:hypothetical protein
LGNSLPVPDLRCYIPCLRWKLGEYKALLNLSQSARDSIFPLIDVAEMGFDFETQTESKTLDQHLNKFALRVGQTWGARGCFVDLRLIDPTARMENGKHPVAFVFDDLRKKGVPAVPVTGLDRDVQWQEVVKTIADQDQRGLCLRISLEEAAKPNLGILIGELLQKFNLGPEECDLILDEGAPNFVPLDGFVGLLGIVISNLPFLEQWRTFALIGCSLPPSLSILGQGTSMLPRYEWLAYKALMGKLQSSGLRLPNFGDYAINHPEIQKGDPRKMRPTANIRYSIEDQWLIVRGKNVKDYGYEQHKGLCDIIVKSKEFSGESFSTGDKYIFACSRGNASTGNLPTWRWVGTNHHLELVTREVATFFAS